MPGIPLLYFGEEQNFYTYDSTASNYLYGRQAMIGNIAWKRHGCYRLGTEQYYHIPLERALLGCHDEWNALDHFDPTANSRRMFAQFNRLRNVYGALQDGFGLIQNGNWTYFIERAGSNGTQTEMGLWSVSRQGLTSQTLEGQHNDVVWMLFTNENATKTYTYDCYDQKLWISTPFQAGTTVRNLFAPYETYQLTESASPFYDDGKEPYRGCLGSVTMDGYGFKALVPEDQWVAPLPALTKFTPGHDHRILSTSDSVDISLEFNVEMDCDSVTNAVSLNMSSSGHGDAPSVANINCGAVQNPDATIIPGDTVSAWAWSATLNNFPDGVLEIKLDNPQGADGGNTTNVSISTGFRENCPDHDCRPSIIFCSVRVSRRTSWSSRTTTTITMRSRRRTASTSSSIKPSVPTSSVIPPTLVRTGRLGGTGRIRLLLTLRSSRIWVSSGKASTLWCNVSVLWLDCISRWLIIVCRLE